MFYTSSCQTEFHVTVITQNNLRQKISYSNKFEWCEFPLAHLRRITISFKSLRFLNIPGAFFRKKRCWFYLTQPFQIYLSITFHTHTFSFWYYLFIPKRIIYLWILLSIYAFSGFCQFLGNPRKQNLGFVIEINHPLRNHQRMVLQRFYFWLPWY